MKVELWLDGRHWMTVDVPVVPHVGELLVFPSGAYDVRAVTHHFAEMTGNSAIWRLWAPEILALWRSVRVYVREAK
jgi:hypothetical protein